MRLAVPAHVIDRRVAAGLLLAGATSCGGRAAAQELRQDHALALVEAKITASFSDMTHITPADLSDRLAQASTRIVLLDVRAPAEIAVSKIAGAVPVDPEARSTHTLVAAVGDLTGKTLVGYCSIGLRSARYFQRIGGSLRERGAVELVNLSGGVFRWRNERRPLVTPDGAATTAVHHYNALWRQFLLD